MGAIGNVIPELVNSFNVYLTGNKLVGVSLTYMYIVNQELLLLFLL